MDGIDLGVEIKLCFQIRPAYCRWRHRFIYIFYDTPKKCKSIIIKYRKKYHKFYLFKKRKKWMTHKLTFKRLKRRLFT